MASSTVVAATPAVGIAEVSSHPTVPSSVSSRIYC
jgi:hypothetical protein